MITFRIVDSSEIGRAFQWHSDFAALNDAIFPRPESTFKDMVFDRQVWCAIDSEDCYLALSYAAYDEDDNVWEIGGLMVTDGARGKGLGDIMMRLPLISMLVTERPMRCSPVPAIVTHVLKSNPAPRNIIGRAGFVFHHDVEIPKDVLPGLRHDEDGMIRGDEFHLQMPEAVADLADWLDEWSLQLRDGSPASLELVDSLTIADWSHALRTLLA